MTRPERSPFEDRGLPGSPESSLSRSGWLVGRRFCIAALLFFAFALPLLMRGNSGDETPSGPTPRIPSYVAWTAATIRLASSGDGFRGLLISRHCGHCHGSEGFSAEPAVPNLAGVDRLSIWKQLEDFRSAKRVSPVMQPIVSVLSAQDSADVAAYFSMLPTFPDPQDNRSFPQTAPDPAPSRAAERLIVFGDGRRGIPPCQACHGPVGYVKGAPPLATQNAQYLLNQLRRFSDGSRANDINLVMRSIARQLTDDEKASVSAYYGAGRGPSAQIAHP